jgi:acyl carrier protein
MSANIDQPSASPHPKSSFSVTTQPKDITHDIIEIWQEHFGDIELSLDDEFFALGGSSLIAVRIINSVQGLLDTEIPIVTLFKYPQLRTFIEEVRAISGFPQELPKVPTDFGQLVVCKGHSFSLRALDAGQDLVCVLGPGEGLRVVVPVVDE